MNETQRMLELYPDAELMPFAKARELVGQTGSCCAACPACYERETGVRCCGIPCKGGNVYVSPVLYIVAKVNEWET